MTRRTALSLVLALALFAGCSAKETESEPAKPAATGNPAYLAVDADGSIARIRQAGVLKVGADPESGLPFWAPALAGESQPRGFEAELAAETAKLFGVEAKLVPTRWSDLLGALKEGQVDIVINGLEVPSSDVQARHPELVFSKPYLSGGDWIVVPPEDKTTERIADLKGMEVAVLETGAAKTLLQEASSKHKLDIKVAGFKTTKDLFHKLETRAVGAALLPQPMAALFLVQNPTFRAAGEAIMPRGYVMAVRRDDKAILNTVNAWLSKSATDEAYQKIAGKWKMQPGG